MVKPKLGRGPDRGSRSIQRRAKPNLRPIACVHTHAERNSANCNPGDPSVRGCIWRSRPPTHYCVASAVGAYCPIGSRTPRLGLPGSRTLIHPPRHPVVRFQDPVWAALNPSGPGGGGDEQRDGVWDTRRFPTTRAIPGTRFCLDGLHLACIPSHWEAIAAVHRRIKYETLGSPCLQEETRIHPDHDDSKRDQRPKGGHHRRRPDGAARRTRAQEGVSVIPVRHV